MEYDVAISGFDQTESVTDPNVERSFAAGHAVGVTFSALGLSLLPADVA
jgi:hypothetical protein